MKRNLSILFLNCSLILVLGHSLLPHNHVQKLYAERYIHELEDFSFAEILQFTLSRDLGINHLQDYVRGISYENTTLVLSHDNVIIISAVMPFTLLSKCQTSFYDTFSLLFKWDVIGAERLRAPPKQA